MQTQRIVLGLAVAIAGIGAVTSASSQEYRGTWEQQMACTPDVWRLCGDQIPDVSRIVACVSGKGDLEWNGQHDHLEVLVVAASEVALDDAASFVWSSLSLHCRDPPWVYDALSPSEVLLKGVFSVATAA